MYISVFDVSQFYFTTAKSVTSECAGETRGGPEVGRRSAYALVIRRPALASAALRALWEVGMRANLIVLGCSVFFAAVARSHGWRRAKPV